MRMHNGGFLPAVVAGAQERWSGDLGSSPGSLPLLALAATAEPDRYDLRLAWRTSAAPAGQPAGEGEEEEQGAGSGSASSSDTGDPSSSSLPATGEETAEPDPEVIANPKLKKLSDEAAKHRVAAKAAQERAAALEARVKELEGKHDVEAVLGQLREARIHNAFLTAAMGKVTDLEAGWKLADKTGVTLTEEGAITGLEPVITKLLEKYPYLAPPITTEEVDPILLGKFPALGTSGSPRNGPKKGTDGLNRGVLEKKFPALKRGR